MIRDPFGYVGPECDRPAIWGAMIGARRSLEYQDQTIAMLCSLSSKTGTWKLPVFPPTDATRNDSVAFEVWRSTMEYRRDMAHGGAENAKEIMALNHAWEAQDGRVLAETHRSEANRAHQCWRFWDAFLGRDVAFDQHGNMLTPRESQRVKETPAGL